MQITNNFTLRELCNSKTAEQKGINNSLLLEKPDNFEQLLDVIQEECMIKISIDKTILQSLEQLTLNVLQPLRDSLGKAITVNSGYRSPDLNKAIGGAKNSQHLKGQAVDIVCKQLDTKQLFEFIIASKLPFDQLILEFYDPKNPTASWVHVSYNQHANRNQKLIATKQAGKTIYTEV